MFFKISNMNVNVFYIYVQFFLSQQWIYCRFMFVKGLGNTVSEYTKKKEQQRQETFEFRHPMICLFNRHITFWRILSWCHCVCSYWVWRAPHWHSKALWLWGETGSSSKRKWNTSKGSMGHWQTLARGLRVWGCKEVLHRLLLTDGG